MEEDPDPTASSEAREAEEEALEKPLSLNEQRLGAVVAALRASGAKRVLDLGCGSGKLLRALLKDRQFEEIVGMDVSIASLEIAEPRLRLERLAPRQRERVELIHGRSSTGTGGWRASTPPPWSRWSSTSTRPGCRRSSGCCSSSPGRGRSC